MYGYRRPPHLYCVATLPCEKTQKMQDTKLNAAVYQFYDTLITRYMLKIYFFLSLVSLHWKIPRNSCQRPQKKRK